MKGEESIEEEQVEKISALNAIFENLIVDASELVKDLYWGVKTYIFFGLISLLFGVETILLNMDVLQSRFYIPLFVGGALIFCGLVQIFNYFRLSGKYSKLFKIQDELKKS
jgi:uncharacterized membrane protein HdeD (DUF308 family)